jgi:hypothetical protein
MNDENSAKSHPIESKMVSSLWVAGVRKTRGFSAEFVGKAKGVDSLFNIKSFFFLEGVKGKPLSF